MDYYGIQDKLRELGFKPVKIEGEDYDGPDGKKVRRFIQGNGDDSLTGDIGQLVEELVLCRMNYVRSEDGTSFEGVRICNREVGDLQEALVSPSNLQQYAPPSQDEHDIRVTAFENASLENVAMARFALESAQNAFTRINAERLQEHLQK